jgi:nitroreductase
MSLLDAIASRRSVGRMRPDPIPREAVEELLAAAVSAPNHHLTAPWRFVVLAGDARRELGEAHARAVAREKPGLPPEGLEKEAARLERAPVVVAAIVLGADDPVQAREDRDAVAAAIMNLLLAAHGRGLGAMWRTGAMVDEPEVRAALALGPGDAVVGFVYLGHPDGPPPRRPPRPGIDEVAIWRGW